MPEDRLPDGGPRSPLTWAELCRDFTAVVRGAQRVVRRVELLDLVTRTRAGAAELGEWQRLSLMIRRLDDAEDRSGMRHGVEEEVTTGRASAERAWRSLRVHTCPSGLCDRRVRSVLGQAPECALLAATMPEDGKRPAHGSG